MNIAQKIEDIARIVGLNDLTPDEKYRNIRQKMLIGENRSKEEILSSVFMVAVGLVLIIFMVLMESTYYETAGIGDWRMRVILALAGGAMAVGFSGNINIKFHWVQSSGSLAIVLLIFLVDPGSLSRQVGNIGDQFEQKLQNENSRTSIGSFFISSAFAENEEKSVTISETENNSAFPVLNNEGKSLQKIQGYNFQINYPVGVKDLKNESFRLGQSIVKTGESNQIKVYSLGSIFRAPINALTYDNKYDIQVKYNRLIEQNSLEPIIQSLQENIDNEHTKLNAVAGSTLNADIIIELKPK